MAAKSPGRLLELNKVCTLRPKPTDDVTNVKKMCNLLKTLASCFGTQGRVRILHNNCGGDPILTTSSDQLLNCLSVSSPVLKFVTAVIKEHVKMYSDGGLFLGIFCLHLITKALNLEINRRLIIEVYELLLKESLDMIQSAEFPCQHDNCTDSVEVHGKLIRSMFTSKPACLLFHHDLDHICHLALNGYQQCSSPDGAMPLLYLMAIGRPPKESCLIPGILCESPQIPVYQQKYVLLSQSDCDLIPVCLVQTSMAGDSEAFLDVTYDLTAGYQLTDVVLTQLESFVASMAAAGVKVLLCQKVVHPKIYKLLKRHKVLVLDRLGHVLFEAAHKLAGGIILDPFSISNSWQFTSFLGQVEHVIINSKSYIHIDGVNHGKYAPISTVILCHRTEQGAREMQTTFQKCQHVLRLTEQCGRVLCGGGCWQSALCLHITEKVGAVFNQWANRLDCSVLQISQITETFLSALQQTVLSLYNSESWSHAINPLTGHHHVLSSVSQNKHCACRATSCNELDDFSNISLSSICRIGNHTTADHCQGQKLARQKPSVEDLHIVDAYLPFVNAFQAAVTTSCMVLGIQNYIQDVT